MPTYTYQCTSCTDEDLNPKVVEIWKSISKADDVELCLECSNEMVKKISSTFSITQKGYCYNNSERQSNIKDSSTT